MQWLGFRKSLYFTFTAAVAHAILTETTNSDQFTATSLGVGPRGWQAAAAAAAAAATQPTETAPFALDTLESAAPRLREQTFSQGIKLGRESGSDGMTPALWDGSTAVQLEHTVPKDEPHQCEKGAQRGGNNSGHRSPAMWVPLFVLLLSAAFSAGFAMGVRQEVAAAAVRLEAAATHLATQQTMSDAPAAPPTEVQRLGNLGSAVRGTDGDPIPEDDGSSNMDPIPAGISPQGDSCPAEPQIPGTGINGLVATGQSIMESGDRSEVDAASAAFDGLLVSGSSCMSQMLPDPVSGLVFLGAPPDSGSIPSVDFLSDEIATTLHPSDQGDADLSAAESLTTQGSCRDAEATLLTSHHSGAMSNENSHRNSDSVSATHVAITSSPTTSSVAPHFLPTAKDYASSATQSLLQIPTTAALTGATQDSHQLGVGVEPAAWDEATALVGAMSQRLGVDLGGLSVSEKIQLISVVVGAWQTFQQNSHHRVTTSLGLDANKLRREHTAVVHTGLQRKEARHSAAAAAAGAAALQRGVVDCLLGGLVIMVSTCLYSGVRYGFLGQRIAACPAFHSRGGSRWGLLRPLQLVRPLQAAACWVFTTGDVMLGVVMVLVLAYGALRTSVLSGMQTTPLLRMVVGLGLACGGAGYVAIGKMGGNADVWLAYWEVWVAVQSAVIWYSRVVQKLLQLSNSNGWPRWLAVFLVKPTWVLVVAVLAPLSTGLVPFQRTVIQEFNWLWT